MAVIRNGDAELHVDRAGTPGGQPLLMIAGASTDGAAWAPLLPHLPGCDAILPDARMTGRTLPLTCALSRDLMTRDMLAVLDGLGIARAHVVGHSLGGLVALDLAVLAPERVASVTVLSMADRISDRIRALFEDLAALEIGSLAWFGLLYQFIFSPALLDDRARLRTAAAAAVAYPHRQPAAAFRAQARLLEEYATPAPLTRVRCPVLALTGANDLLCPPAAQEIFDTLPDARRQVIPAAAHALHWEAAVPVAAALRHFLPAGDSPISPQ